MAERLARGTFERLARSIWRVGRLGMRGVLEAAPVPCRVEKDFRYLRNILQIELDLVAHDITDQPEPIWMAATLADVAPFNPHPDLDIYNYQTLTLDLATRRKTFETGMYLSDGNGLTITVYPGEAGMAPAGLGTARWEDLANDGAKPVFGQAQADHYLRELHTFAEHIRQH